MTLLGPLYGQGNTLRGVSVNEGSKMFILSTLAPGATGLNITGLTGDIQLDAADTAIPELVAGAAVPATSALTTWAHWVAAPFSRNAMNYKSGESITNIEAT